MRLRIFTFHHAPLPRAEVFAPAAHTRSTLQKHNIMQRRFVAIVTTVCLLASVVHTMPLRRHQSSGGASSSAHALASKLATQSDTSSGQAMPSAHHGPPILSIASLSPFPANVSGDYRGTWSGSAPNSRPSTFDVDSGMLLYRLRTYGTKIDGGDSNGFPFQIVAGELIIRNGQRPTSKDMRFHLQGAYFQFTGVLKLASYEIGPLVMPKSSALHRTPAQHKRYQQYDAQVRDQLKSSLTVPELARYERDAAREMTAILQAKDSPSALPSGCRLRIQMQVDFPMSAATAHGSLGSNPSEMAGEAAVAAAAGRGRTSYYTIDNKGRLVHVVRPSANERRSDGDVTATVITTPSPTGGSSNAVKVLPAEAVDASSRTPPASSRALLKAATVGIAAERRKQAAARAQKKRAHDNAVTLAKHDSIRMTGLVLSKECHFNMTMSAATIHFEEYYSKAINYGIVVTLMTWIQVRSLMSQMEASASQARADKVSVITIGMMALLDSYLCLFHLTTGIIFDALFNMFVTTAFFEFVIFSLFEMRFLLLIWKARRPEAFNNGWERMRREMSVMYLRFYAALIVGIFSMYVLQRVIAVPVLVMFSFWVPQIVNNARRDSNKALNPSFLATMSITRLFIPLYVFGCPHNFLGLPTSGAMCVALVLWQCVQVAVLVAQDKYGPRCFIPARFLPPRYNYHRRRRRRAAGGGGGGDVAATPTADDVNSNGSSIAMQTLGMRSRAGNNSSGPEDDVDDDGAESTSLLAAGSSSSSSPSTSSTSATRTTGAHMSRLLRGSASPTSSAAATSDVSSPTSSDAWLHTLSANPDVSPAASPTSSSDVRVDVASPSSTLRDEEREPESDDAGNGIDDDDNPDDDDPCPICFCDLESERLEDVMVCPCEHAFHSTCLLQWMEQAMVCPTCRGPLPPV